jgi:GTPase SAR1 family protein
MAIIHWLIIDYEQYHTTEMFDESTRIWDVKYKIVFLGPSSAGKSAIIERFTTGSFDPNRGVAFC